MGASDAGPKGVSFAACELLHEVAKGIDHARLSVWASFAPVRRTNAHFSSSLLSIALAAAQFLRGFTAKEVAPPS